MALKAVCSPGYEYIRQVLISDRSVKMILPTEPLQLTAVPAAAAGRSVAERNLELL